MATTTTRPRAVAPATPSAHVGDAPTLGHTRRRLTVAVAVLLAVSSVGGLLVEDLYQEPDAVAAMLRGYDLAALVAVPLLAATSLPVLRASMRARLAAAGLLAFVVYDYAYYVFGTSFNDLFLLHATILSTAMFALVLSLASLAPGDVAARFHPRTPTRAVAAILGVFAVSLAGMWIAGSLGYALDGTLPDDGNALVSTDTLTHLGYAMDLVFLVPAYALAAVLLWRRRPWGYPLAVTMLVSGALTQVTYMMALVFQARADVPGASPFDPLAPVILALYLVGAGLLLGNVQNQPTTQHRCTPAHTGR